MKIVINNNGACDSEWCELIRILWIVFGYMNMIQHDIMKPKEGS